MENRASWQIILTAGLLLLSALAARKPVTTPGGAERSIVDLPVESFTVSNVDMEKALLALRSSDVDRIVIGFEGVPHLPATTNSSISVALRNTTVGEVMDHLCEADPRYECTVIQGVMVEVRPKDTPANPKDLLNLEIRNYDVETNITAPQAINQIGKDAPELRDLLQRKADDWAKRAGGEHPGFPGSIISGNMPPPLFSLHLHDVTVRQILNAISLKSIEMFRHGPDYGPNGLPLKQAPVGWEYDFTVDPDAPTGLGGYPKWAAF